MKCVQTEVYVLAFLCVLKNFPPVGDYERIVAITSARVPIVKFYSQRWLVWYTCTEVMCMPTWVSFEKVSREVRVECVRVRGEVIRNSEGVGKWVLASCLLLTIVAPLLLLFTRNIQCDISLENKLVNFHDMQYAHSSTL